MIKEKPDSKDSKRGDFYQALVSIKYAIDDEFSDFDTLTIEHKGDISFDNNVQIETKHHTTSVTLSDTHEDFWKTLYNWISLSESFEKYILHTTSDFPLKDSHLRKWNNSNTETRLNFIKHIRFIHRLEDIQDYKISDVNIKILSNCGVVRKTLDLLESFKNKVFSKDQFEKLIDDNLINEPERGILIRECKNTSLGKYKVWNYQRVVNSIPNGRILPIIERIEIKTKQPIDTELVKLIAQMGAFKFLPYNNKKDIENAIAVNIAGFIQSKVIGEKRWEISSNEFSSVIQRQGTVFYNEKYRKSFDKYLMATPTDDDVDSFRKNKTFVKELNSIECDEDEVTDAIIDNWRTLKTINEEIKYDPTFFEEEYLVYRDEIIFKTVKNIRREHEHSEDIRRNIIESRKFYRMAARQQFGDFQSIKSYPYFTHGTMHNLIEDEMVNFSWVL